MTRTLLNAAAFAMFLAALIAVPAAGQGVTMEERAACNAISEMRNLTILMADIREDGGGSAYCYVRGIIAPAIGFHVQLPLRGDWNQRFLMWGDGGKDGDLDFANQRMGEGYAVANTNMGHDSGVEPGSSFGYDNRQAEIDFGHRAVHLTTVAAKAIVDEFYGQGPDYSYFEGCSTGGREGLMEAQRYPYDFDGIVAGAPAHRYQDLNASRTWLLQNMYLDDYSGSLSYDTDGDGRPDSARKLEILADAVLANCDGIDGIEDGVIDDPRDCTFDPVRDLADLMCPGDVNGEACFTRLQVEHVEDFYSGAYDSAGRRIYPGHSIGSESEWLRLYVPYAGNNYRAGALGVTGDHLNYLFYETDPGVAPPAIDDPTVELDAAATPAEWAWWQFDIDDVTRGEGDIMKTITDANDPDLGRFLGVNGGKLILFHGWVDSLIVPTGTLEYYEEMVERTFEGDMTTARDAARLFMVPGMGHCGGGPGPTSWDRLPPLVEWVEEGNAPDALIASRSAGGQVVNERPIFAYPDRAVYTGPAGGQNDPANWVADNFGRR